jgi:four helix bundle protein
MERSGGFGGSDVPLEFKPVFRGKGDLSNQIQRAALSISNNIAEGFERGTTRELLAFIYYARGSAGEVRSMLSVMEMMCEFDNLKSEISNLKLKAENISRQLRGWANSLQNSDIAGQKYLTDGGRDLYHRQKSAEEFSHRIQESVKNKTMEDFFVDRSKKDKE